MKIILLTTFLVSLASAQFNSTFGASNPTAPSTNTSTSTASTGSISLSGGWSVMKTLDKRVDADLIDKFISYKNIIGTTMNTVFTGKFEPVEYSQQVVSGMNYKIKYNVDGGKAILVQIYQPVFGSSDLPVVTGILDDGDGNSMIINTDPKSQDDSISTYKAGGLSDWNQIGKEDSELWRLFNSWQGMVELNMNRNFLYFDAIAYKKQVVAGTIYQIKYAVGMNEFVVVEIFKPLPMASNQTPKYRRMVSDTFERDSTYQSSAMIVKTCMLASAVSALLFA